MNGCDALLDSYQKIDPAAYGVMVSELKTRLFDSQICCERIKEVGATPVSTNTLTFDRDTLSQPRLLVVEK